MRRRNKRSTRFSISLNALGNVQTFLVNRNRHEMTTIHGEDSPRQVVTRFLHPHPAARVGQNSRRKLERLLRTVDDHDLIGFASHRSRGSQIARNRFAEGLQSHLVAVVKRLGVHLPAMTRDQARPHLEWKLIKCHLSHRECSKTQRPREYFAMEQERTAVCDRSRSGAGHGTRRQLSCSTRRSARSKFGSHHRNEQISSILRRHRANQRSCPTRATSLIVSSGRATVFRPSRRFRKFACNLSRYT